MQVIIVKMNDTTVECSIAASELHEIGLTPEAVINGAENTSSFSEIRAVESQEAISESHKTKKDWFTELCNRYPNVSFIVCDDEYGCTAVRAVFSTEEQVKTYVDENQYTVDVWFNGDEIPAYSYHEWEVE